MFYQCEICMISKHKCFSRNLKLTSLFMRNEKKRNNSVAARFIQIMMELSPNHRTFVHRASIKAQLRHFGTQVPKQTHIFSWCIIFSRKERVRRSHPLTEQTPISCVVVQVLSHLDVCRYFQQNQQRSPAIGSGKIGHHLFARCSNWNVFVTIVYTR